MEQDIARLVNGMRTSAIGKPDSQEVLSIADVLESMLRRQEKELGDLHGTLSQVQRELATVRKELAEKTEALTLAEEKLRILIAFRFGRSSERWKPDMTLQKELFNEAEMLCSSEPEGVVDDVPEASSTKNTKTSTAPLEEEKLHGGRKPFPENLPRVEELRDLSESEKICSVCGKPLERIGEDVSERLQMKPIEWYVQRTVRPKYACSCADGGVHEAPVPNQIVPKSMIGETVAAQIIASKYCDALPFFRQESILSQRWGIDISRQTMARTAVSVAALLRPLETLLVQRLSACAVLCADETRVRVLHEDGEKKEGQSWMWVVTGESEGVQLVRFRYDAGRDKEAAEELLMGFHGILMTDDYASYNDVVTKQGIIRASCMAHVRRRFNDVLKANKKNRYAADAMSFITGLYQVERDHATDPPAEKLVARQQQSRSIFEQFRTWLYEYAPTVVPKSVLGTAISYAINLLPRLEVYLTDGRVPIDNNRAERAIRPFVVGRKSWLFQDQAVGAKASATLYSIIETARANTMEPMHYLLFLFRCYERFGPDAMPWDKLLPVPALRDYAATLGIPYSI